MIGLLFQNGWFSKPSLCRQNQKTVFTQHRFSNLSYKIQDFQPYETFLNRDHFFDSNIRFILSLFSTNSRP